MIININLRKLPSQYGAISVMVGYCTLVTFVFLIGDPEDTFFSRRYPYDCRKAIIRRHWKWHQTVSALRFIPFSLILITKFVPYVSTVWPRSNQGVKRPLSITVTGVLKHKPDMRYNMPNCRMPLTFLIRRYFFFFFFDLSSKYYAGATTRRIGR